MMEQLRLGHGCVDDNVGVPEELRCKRSDGKQWRCSALSMPDKTVCEKHYIQAKKRAANSALRASLKKAKRKALGDGADAYLEDRHCELDKSRSLSPVNVSICGLAGSVDSVKKCREKMPKGLAIYSMEGMVGRGLLARGGMPRHGEELQRDGIQDEDNNKTRSAYSALTSREVKSFGGSRPGEYSGRSSDSSGAAMGLTCHQCQRSARVVWCSSCERRGYCSNCISRWYPEIPVDDVRKVCPACRGICNCRVCLRGDNLIKVKVQEMAGIDKLRYLHSLLVHVLPVLKQIYAEQCFEIGVEARIYGPKSDIPRAKMGADEQMCCDFCRVPIFDYHRHCTQCFYDLCLTCCRDLRRATMVATGGEPTEFQAPKRTKYSSAATTRIDSFSRSSDKQLPYSDDANIIEFAHLFPSWKANSDGSVPCGPVEAGGCGSPKLVLRRIFKINWIAKLVKVAEEMVNGCRVDNSDKSDRCLSCKAQNRSESMRGEFSLSQCSNRSGGRTNLLYSPMLEVINHEGIGHFHKHWARGEPIVIRHAFQWSLASSWEPLSIWRGIKEAIDEQMDDDIVVKAIDCLNQTEVDIELNKFIKGYSEGHRREDGRPQMLILKDWPPPRVVEEFLLCQRPEFLINFPLVDFIHSKWGVLNLAAKVPHDPIQPESAPKLLIAYGSHAELGKGDSVANLQINMGDVVYMLMHTAEVNSKSFMSTETEQNGKICVEATSRRLQGNTYLSDHNISPDARMQPRELTIRSNIENEYALGSRFKEERFLGNAVCNGPEIASAERNFSDSPRPGRESFDYVERSHSGALWDVFRRQDVPKLNEYLRIHLQEFITTSQPVHSITHPIYNQAIFLTKDQKMTLKVEYGIEPWTFRQHVGEAVFIPAGCPFQAKNLQSSVQLVLDFLSPESLAESARMAQEIRCLPNDHDAKLKMFEVGKMSLYAASSAIREIEKISLDSKLSSDARFDDHNLTATVSENLDKITKRRQAVCV